MSAVYDVPVASLVIPITVLMSVPIHMVIVVVSLECFASDRSSSHSTNYAAGRCCSNCRSPAGYHQETTFARQRPASEPEHAWLRKVFSHKIFDLRDLEHIRALGLYGKAFSIDQKI
jgi:hypothetical protein